MLSYEHRRIFHMSIDLNIQRIVSWETVGQVESGLVSFGSPLWTEVGNLQLRNLSFDLDLLLKEPALRRVRAF